MDSLATTLLYGTAQNTDLWVSPDPPLGSVLAVEAHRKGFEVSRMPIWGIDCKLDSDKVFDVLKEYSL